MIVVLGGLIVYNINKELSSLHSSVPIAVSTNNSSDLTENVLDRMNMQKQFS